MEDFKANNWDKIDTAWSSGKRESVRTVTYVPEKDLTDVLTLCGTQMPFQRNNETEMSKLGII